MMKREKKYQVKFCQSENFSSNSSVPLVWAVSIVLNISYLQWSWTRYNHHIEPNSGHNTKCHPCQQTISSQFLLDRCQVHQQNRYQIRKRMKKSNTLSPLFSSYTHQDCYNVYSLMMEKLIYLSSNLLSESDVRHWTWSYPGPWWRGRTKLTCQKRAAALNYVRHW